MQRVLARVLLVAAMSARAAVAEEGGSRAAEVEVTAARLATSVESTGARVFVVSGAELAEMQISRAAQALRIVPGAYLGEGGGPGASASLFLRGAGSNQTLVLLDGVRVNDPTIGGQFNFYDLDAGGLERMEVLRGAASAFHGSDAIGGVVNFVTPRGRGDPAYRVGAEGGSFGHYRLSLSGGADLGMVDVYTSVSRNRWGGDGPDREYHDETLAGTVGVEPHAGTRVEFRARYSDSVAHDPWDFPFGPQIEADGNIRRDRRAGLASLSVTQDLSETWTLRASASLFDVKSKFRNGPDTAGDPDELVSRSAAQDRRGSLSVGWAPGELTDGVALRALAGFDAADEISENTVRSSYGPSPPIDRTVRNRAAFLLAEVELQSRAVLSGGLRRDRNSFFGWRTTASASLLVRVPETGSRLRASYGEGFRAPKPVEYADPFVGNPDLGPERAVMVDAGVEQDLLDGALVLSATFFQLRGRDFIAYDFATFRLENLGRVRVRGVEFEAAAEPVEGLRIRGWLTIQDPVNESAAPGAKDQLPGRPKRFGGADVSWRTGPLLLGASVTASDDVPGVGRITPEGRVRNHPGRKLLVCLLAAWEVSPGFRLTGRIENLLGREWYDDETAAGGLGRTFVFGFSVDF